MTQFLTPTATPSSTAHQLDPLSTRALPTQVSLAAQPAGLPLGSWSETSGFADKVFASISIALVFAACVVATRTWIESGWTQISIFALLYLLARALVGCLFEPNDASRAPALRRGVSKVSE